MKKKKVQELHQQSINQLAKLAAKTQSELAILQIDLGAGRLKDINQVKKKRRALARIKTIIKQKELEAPVKTGKKEA